MEKIYTEVQLHKGNTTLNITVNEDLKREEREEGVLKNSGNITIHDGRLDTKEVFWDNLSYFFNIDKKKKKDIKSELKKKGQYYKGVVKDIKTLINRAKELDLLCL